MLILLKEYPFYGMAFHPEAVIYSWMEKQDSSNRCGCAVFPQK